MKFLIADNDKNNNSELNLALSEYGISDAVMNGGQAIALLKNTVLQNPALRPLNQQLYKAIFIGLDLKDKNGISLLREIRGLGTGEYSQTPVLIMSDSSEMASVLGIFNKTDVRFIKKPIDKIIISQMVQTIKS